MKTMQIYTGVKIIAAEPMNLGEYNKYRGWQIPENETATAEGYLVEYANSKSNHLEHSGYISWSPKLEFENAYIVDDAKDKVTIDIALLAEHENRVVTEYQDLYLKKEKLVLFLAAQRESKNPVLSEYDILLLSQQAITMVHYIKILMKRIKNFKAVKTGNDAK